MPKIYVGDRAGALLMLKGGIVVLCIAAGVLVFAATHSSDETKVVGGFELNIAADAGK